MRKSVRNDAGKTGYVVILRVIEDVEDGRVYLAAKNRYSGDLESTRMLPSAKYWLSEGAATRFIEQKTAYNPSKVQIVPVELGIDYAKKLL